MAKIIGNTVGMPNPRPDWNQNDESKADYIKNKPKVTSEVQTGNQSLVTSGGVYNAINNLDIVSSINGKNGDVTLTAEDIAIDEYNSKNVKDVLDDKASLTEVNAVLMDTVPHTVRIPAFEEIDNSAFIPKITACATTWLDAHKDDEIKYGSLDSGEMKYRINPMLYAVRTDSGFTADYRDIYSEARTAFKASESVESTDASKRKEAKTVNCITLCNMLIMGIPYRGSRLCGHENVIGMSGYAFDICKFNGVEKRTDGSIAWQGDNISYTPNQKLDINTFTSILTQKNFFDTYNSFGLVKTVETKKGKGDGQIWYSDIRPGDILWEWGPKSKEDLTPEGKHSMMCLSVSYDSENETTTITGVEANTGDKDNIADDLGTFTFTVKDSGTITGLGSNRYIHKVARPYYSWVTPETEGYKRIKGPYIGIPNGADLDKYLTVGEYRCINVDAKTIANMPSTLKDDFRLTVENITKSEDELNNNAFSFLQTITAANGDIYVRTLSSMDMTTKLPDDWKEADGYPDNYFFVDNPNPKINGWKRLVADPAVKTINKNEDLNTIKYTTVGEYRCETEAIAKSINHRPRGIENKFRLIVENVLGDYLKLDNERYFLQRIREINGAEYWRRIFYKNNAPEFGNWHRVATQNLSEDEYGEFAEVTSISE